MLCPHIPKTAEQSQTPNSFRDLKAHEKLVVHCLRPACSRSTLLLCPQHFMNHQFCSGGRGKQHMRQKNSQREKINYYLREEWESSPPLSRSSNEIQRGETSPDRATRRRVHHMTKPVKKRHTLLLLLKPHVKATL